MFCNICLEIDVERRFMVSVCWSPTHCPLPIADNKTHIATGNANLNSNTFAMLHNYTAIDVSMRCSHKFQNNHFMRHFLIELNVLGSKGGLRLDNVVLLNEFVWKGQTRGMTVERGREDGAGGVSARMCVARIFKLVKLMSFAVSLMAAMTSNAISDVIAVATMSKTIIYSVENIVMTIS